MKKIAYLGSKTLGLSLLKALHTANDQWRIIHPDDESDGRSCLPAFRQYASEQGIDFLVASSPSAADAMLVDFSPDVVFVCGWYWLLKQAALDRVPMGFWGAHNSLLPKYRGGSPLVWALIRGEPVVGSTVFRFKPGMDDGPVLHRVETEVRHQDHIADVLDRIEAALLAELPAKWGALLRGEATLEEQDETQATYCGQRIPADGRIDWTKSAVEVRNFIRGQSRPYPGAFTVVGEDKVTVWDAELDERPWYGVPGQVLVRTSDGVIVACGQDSAVRLTEVERDGALVEPRTAFTTTTIRLA